MRKADLVELTLRLAQEAKACEWLLERETGLDKPVQLLVYDIEVAIELATRIDEQKLNCNPEIDWLAYDAVRRGLSQLVKRERIEEAKSLALRLMESGSLRIESSDEGLMSEEIEQCLRLVIAAVVDSSGGREWAWQMLRQDRMGFLCRRELAELAGVAQGD